MSSTDLEGRLVACRARKARAAKDFETAENDYHRRLLDADGHATTEQRRMEGAAANLKAEEDRERVLLAEIEARDAAARRAAIEASRRKDEKTLAEMAKGAVSVDDGLAALGKSLASLTALANTLSLKVDGRPDVKAVEIIRDGVVAALVRNCVADWVIPNSGFMRSTEPGVGENVARIKELVGQRYDAEIEDAA